MRFKNGCIAVFENAYVLPDESPAKIDGKLELLGTKGAVYVDTADQGFSTVSENRVTSPDIGFWPTLNNQLVGALREELIYFARCVAEDREPEVVKPSDAGEALRLALLAYESAVEGGKAKYL